METKDADNCIAFWSKNRLIRVWSMAILVIAIFSAYMLFGQTPVAVAESELEPNNSIQSAQYIKTNMNYTGNLSTYNDVDYYKFVIDSPGKVYLSFRHEQVTSGSWYVKVLDASNNELSYFTAYSGDINVRSYYLRLPAGTYYVRISANTHNDIDYGLTVNYSPEGEGYEKEWNNSMSTAQAINTNHSYTGNLYSSSDVDYYKYVIDSPGKVYLNFRHEQVTSGSWYVKVLDASNNELTSLSIYSGDVNVRSYYLRLPAGTYFVRISTGSHNDIDYALTVNYSAEGEGYEKEWNNSMSAAQGININQTYTGNLCSNNDVDYYKFSIASTTDLSIDFRHAQVQSGSWYIQLLDSNNKRLAEFSSYSSDLKKTSLLKNLVAGTYYLRISGSNCDYDYDMVVVTETLIPVDYVTLDQNSLQLRVGDNPVTLKASIYPSNASNKNCAWTSSNTDVVTVNDGKVTPLAQGNATITVTTRDGARSASCEVEVIEGLSEWTDFFTNRQKSVNDPWIIKFSLGVDFGSVTYSNIFVATDEAGINKINGISLSPVPGDASQTQVLVKPPSNGWQPGTTYYLFISKNVRSSAASGNKELGKGIRMRFNVDNTPNYGVMAAVTSVPYVNIGGQNQQAGDIVLEENIPGSIVPGRYMGFTLPPGVTFASLPAVTVTSGDIYLDTAGMALYDQNRTLRIPVLSSSSIAPGRIIISNIQLNIDNTVPQGDIILSVSGTATGDVGQVPIATVPGT
jgi:uncharacterized protein YjdB